MKIGFVGLGKLGLPVALAVESKGHQVFGYDISPHVKESLTKKKLNYKELGADDLIKNTNITFTSLSNVIKKSDIIFVPIQTPHDPRYEGTTKMPKKRIDFDYSFLKKGISMVSVELNKLKKNKSVIIISTVLPGTIRREIMPIKSKYMRLGYNPFFIAMGTTVKDFLFPEFILFGSNDNNLIKEAKNFYKSITGSFFF